jgi:hypothetical protein
VGPGVDFQHRRGAAGLAVGRAAGDENIAPQLARGRLDYRTRSSSQALGAWNFGWALGLDCGASMESGLSDVAPGGMRDTRGPMEKGYLSCLGA